jgi:prepilin-type N-terminal cleavage/methylation domain-containing protein
MFKIGIRDTRGFSLIELGIVLVVAAVMATVSIPMLADSMRGMQLLSDARNIATTLSYAKLNATSQMTRFQLTFDLENNQWRLQRFNRATGLYELQQAVNGLSMGISHSEIAFKGNSANGPAGFPTASSTDITFNSRGVPTAMGIVYLTNNDTDYAVSVSLAGKVQVWRLQNSQWAPV